MSGSLGYEIMAMQDACETTPYQRQDCPNCGHTLESATDGILHCKMCEWVDQKRTPVFADPEEVI